MAKIIIIVIIKNFNEVNSSIIVIKLINRIYFYYKKQFQIIYYNFNKKILYK